MFRLSSDERANDTAGHRADPDDVVVYICYRVVVIALRGGRLRGQRYDCR